jgi:hypothetical protein
VGHLVRPAEVFDFDGCSNREVRSLIARGPTLKWKWVVVSVSAPLEIVDVTGQYDFQQHKQHHMESLRFEWKGGLVRRIRDES